MACMQVCLTTHYKLPPHTLHPTTYYTPRVCTVLHAHKWHPTTPRDVPRPDTYVCGCWAGGARALVTRAPSPPPLPPPPGGCGCSGSWGRAGSCTASRRLEVDTRPRHIRNHLGGTGVKIVMGWLVGRFKRDLAFFSLQRYNTYGDMDGAQMLVTFWMQPRGSYMVNCGLR